MPEFGFPLTDKVVLQLGGTGLLGRALITALARNGATVIVASRTPAELDNDAQLLRAAGARILLETVDLLAEDSVLELCRRLLATQGRLDGMVYNAVSRPMSKFDDPLSRWEESMRLNATGFFAASRACAEAMANAGRGSIVNISSQMGMVGPNNYLYEGLPAVIPPDYFFHKAGMLNLTRYLAAHYGSRGVRVNAISPGGILNSERPPPPTFVERYSKMTMLGRMANATEVSGAVVFLLSDASSYITGANLPVDGGYTAK